jgi:hypothetical protein
MKFTPGASAAGITASYPYLIPVQVGYAGSVPLKAVPIGKPSSIEASIEQKALGISSLYHVSAWAVLPAISSSYSYTGIVGSQSAKWYIQKQDDVYYCYEGFKSYEQKPDAKKSLFYKSVSALSGPYTATASNTDPYGATGTTALYTNVGTTSFYFLPMLKLEAITSQALPASVIPFKYPQVLYPQNNITCIGAIDRARTRLLGTYNSKSYWALGDSSWGSDPFIITSSPTATTLPTGSYWYGPSRQYSAPIYYFSTPYSAASSINGTVQLSVYEAGLNVYPVTTAYHLDAGSFLNGRTARSYGDFKAVAPSSLYKEPLNVVALTAITGAPTALTNSVSGNYYKAAATSRYPVLHKQALAMHTGVGATLSTDWVDKLYVETGRSTAFSGQGMWMYDQCSHMNGEAVYTAGSWSLWKAGTGNDAQYVLTPANSITGVIAVEGLPPSSQSYVYDVTGGGAKLEATDASIRAFTPSYGVGVGWSFNVSYNAPASIRCGDGAQLYAYNTVTYVKETGYSPVGVYSKRPLLNSLYISAPNITRSATAAYVLSPATISAFPFTKLAPTTIGGYVRALAGRTSAFPYFYRNAAEGITGEYSPGSYMPQGTSAIKIAPVYSHRPSATMVPAYLHSPIDTGSVIKTASRTLIGSLPGQLTGLYLQSTNRPLNILDIASKASLWTDNKPVIPPVTGYFGASKAPTGSDYSYPLWYMGNPVIDYIYPAPCECNAGYRIESNGNRTVTSSAPGATSISVPGVDFYTYYKQSEEAAASTIEAVPFASFDKVHRFIDYSLHSLNVSGNRSRPLKVQSVTADSLGGAIEKAKEAIYVTGCAGANERPFGKCSYIDGSYVFDPYTAVQRPFCGPDYTYTTIGDNAVRISTTWVSGKRLENYSICWNSSEDLIRASYPGKAWKQGSTASWDDFCSRTVTGCLSLQTKACGSSLTQVRQEIYAEPSVRATASSPCPCPSSEAAYGGVLYDVGYSLCRSNGSKAVYNNISRCCAVHWTEPTGPGDIYTGDSLNEVTSPALAKIQGDPVVDKDNIGYTTIGIALGFKSNIGSHLYYKAMPAIGGYTDAWPRGVWNAAALTASAEANQATTIACLSDVFTCMGVTACNSVYNIELALLGAPNLSKWGSADAMCGYTPCSYAPSAQFEAATSIFQGTIKAVTTCAPAATGGDTVSNIYMARYMAPEGPDDPYVDSEPQAPECSEWGSFDPETGEWLPPTQGCLDEWEAYNEEYTEWWRSKADWVTAAMGSLVDGFHIRWHGNMALGVICSPYGSYYFTTGFYGATAEAALNAMKGVVWSEHPNAFTLTGDNYVIRVERNTYDCYTPGVSVVNGYYTYALRALSIVKYSDNCYGCWAEFAGGVWYRKDDCDPN